MRTTTMSLNRRGVAARARGGAHARGIDSSLLAGALSVPSPWLSTEIDLARRSGTNVLLIGPGPRSDRVLATLRRDVVKPVTMCRGRDGLVLPSPDKAGTLIVRDVDALSRADQQQLLDWLERAANVKVISTAAAPVLPAVERKTFSDVLYYRLNTICIVMD